MDDERLISEALRAEAARREFSVPPAGLVWWKAELRMRREKAERAMRPIALAEKGAVACSAVAMAAVCVWGLSSGQSQMVLAAVGAFVVLAAGAGSALWVARTKK
jgi:hypothetical protein